MAWRITVWTRIGTCNLLIQSPTSNSLGHGLPFHATQTCLQISLLELKGCICFMNSKLASWWLWFQPIVEAFSAILQSPSLLPTCLLYLCQTNGAENFSWELYQFIGQFQKYILNFTFIASISIFTCNCIRPYALLSTHRSVFLAGTHILFMTFQFALFFWGLFWLFGVAVGDDQGLFSTLVKVQAYGVTNN